MDEFEKRLKRDADAIQAEVTPELRARIDASLRGTGQVRPANRQAEPAPANLWWASSLTGLAAAVMTPLTGNNDKLSTRITDLNLVELGGSQYYRLQIASSAGKGAFTASEIFDGLILPRN